MKRLPVLIACSLLAAACRGDRPENSAAEQTAAPEAVAAAPSAQPGGAPADPRETVEIDDAMVAKYVEYEKENVRILEDYIAETRKNLDSARGDAAKTIQQMSVNEQFTKELAEKLDAKRRELGLSAEQLETVKDAAQMTATSRLLYLQMGGDAQLASMEAEQRKSIAALPEGERVAATAEMDKMLKGIRDMRDATDVRTKYGDKAAQAVLKHADALARQRLAVLNLMSKD